MPTIDGNKRKAILKAALELFSEDGFHNAPMARLADQANVGVGSIYRYFKDKNTLIETLYEEVDNALQDDIETTLELLDEFRGLSQAHGFRLTLAIIPVAAQINNDYQNQQYQTTLKKYSDEVHLDYLDLLPAFRKHQEQGNPLPVIAFDGHYDAEGHRVMADSVFNFLQEIPGNCK